MRSEAFGNDLAMPVRYGYILRMLGEVIPERLNVIELLVWREISKPAGGTPGCAMPQVYDRPAIRGSSGTSRNTSPGCGGLCTHLW